MFKSLLTFLKSLFTSAEDATGILDNLVDFSLIHTEMWVDEALSESKRKAEQLEIDEEWKKEKLASIRKSRQR